MKSTYICEDEGIVYDIYIGGKVDYWELFPCTIGGYG